MDSTQNKTPSTKQQEQFIEFLKQNDPEVIDYAEDLLHGIYPQRTITEEQLDQFIKEGKKEEQHYLWERRMENSRKEGEEYLKKLEEDKKQWEQEKRGVKSYGKIIENVLRKNRKNPIRKLILILLNMILSMVKNLLLNTEAIQKLRKMHIILQNNFLLNQ